MKCRICGCSDEHACPGGCYWVEDDLCSRCDKAIEAVARWKIGNLEKLEHQVDAGAGKLGGEDLELEHQVLAGAGELGGEDLELEHQVEDSRRDGNPSTPLDMNTFNIAGKLQLSIGMFNGKFCGTFGLQTLRGGLKPIGGVTPFWMCILTTDELTQLKEAIEGALFHSHCAQLREQYHDARRKRREEDER